ncbi:hypothetical protein [Parabacteroides sp. PF5-6]|uniref:DUF6427 family protein n=1 Tax=Parabacteroides sp. PF5-6 TaxID=1742403 RepID=UPI00240772CB|nr:hypothetical protein [Parabacteroides sp. PF5-6]MDF9831101.1 hypothetical protein [Parabacteroides sp. PF5-6]
MERQRKRTYDHPAVFTYLIAICLVCWIAGYAVSLGYPVAEESSGTLFWDRLCGLFPDKLFAYILGFVLMGGAGYLLYRFNYALVLIREKTFLPLLLFALLSSTNPNFFPLKATSIGVFCMLLAIYQLFTSYHDPFSMVRTFKTALLIAFGSLFWVHILWFLPLFWIGMYNFRSLTPKTFISSVLGVLTVYWFVLGWAVWEMDFSLFTTSLVSLSDFGFTHFDLEGRWADWLSLIYTVILVVIAFANIRTHEHEDSLRSRQFLSFLMLFFVWALVLFCVYENSSGEFVHLASMPAAILYAHLFTSRRNRYTFGLFLLTIVFYPILLFVQLWSI